MWCREREGVPCCRQLSSKVHPVPSPKVRASPYGTVDGHHLHEWINVAVLNLLLNILGCDIV